MAGMPPAILEAAAHRASTLIPRDLLAPPKKKKQNNSTRARNKGTTDVESSRSQEQEGGVFVFRQSDLSPPTTTPASEAAETRAVDDSATASEPIVKTEKKRSYIRASAEAGPWCFTLDRASFEPFVKYCPQRHLRELVCRSHNACASSGDVDNSRIIPRMLQLRAAQAQLLGFSSFAEQSVYTKMIGSVEKVFSFLEELRSVALPAAKRELDELTAFAVAHTHVSCVGHPAHEPLRQWDVSYWSEKLRQHKFAFDSEALRPYFPFPRVLSSLFSLVRRVFGAIVEPARTYTRPDHPLADHRTSVAVWHKDVLAFRVIKFSGDASQSKRVR